MARYSSVMDLSYKYLYDVIKSNKESDFFFIITSRLSSLVLHIVIIGSKIICPEALPMSQSLP